MRDQGCHCLPVQQIFMEVTALLPFPSQPCPLPQQKSSSWLGTGERPWQNNVKIVCSHIQHFRIFLLMTFLFSSPCFPLLFTPFLLLFTPACSLSVVAVAVFPFLHSLLLPTMFLSHFSFYLHIFLSFFPNLSASVP